VKTVSVFDDDGGDGAVVVAVDSIRTVTALLAVMNSILRYRHQQPGADRGYNSIDVTPSKKSRIWFDVEDQQPGTRPEDEGGKRVDEESRNMPE
jgi:hypothetical protein